MIAWQRSPATSPMPPSVQRAFGAARRRFGPVHAPRQQRRAGGEPRRLQKTDDAFWQRMLGVNLTGVYHASARRLPAMLDARTSAASSTSRARRGSAATAYCHRLCAAKHGVIGLTRALALEVAEDRDHGERGVPGLHRHGPRARRDRQHQRARPARSGVEAREALIAGNPQRRLIQPEEVAKAVLWLCAPGQREHDRTEPRDRRRRGDVMAREERAMRTDVETRAGPRRSPGAATVAAVARLHQPGRDAASARRLQGRAIRRRCRAST